MWGCISPDQPYSRREGCRTSVGHVLTQRLHAVHLFVKCLRPNDPGGLTGKCFTGSILVGNLFSIIAFSASWSATGNGTSSWLFLLANVLLRSPMKTNPSPKIRVIASLLPPETSTLPAFLDLDPGDFHVGTYLYVIESSVHTVMQL